MAELEIQKKEVLGSPFMPQSFSEKLKLAEVLCRSNLCPKALDSTEKVFVALQYGHELGLSPMVSVQNIAVVNGKPTIMTDVMGAIVFKSGKLTEYKIEKVPGKNGEIEKVVVSGKRTDNDFYYEASFSNDDAISAGLLSKNDKGDFISSKDNWRKFRITMLEHRAKSRFLKGIFPEMLAGFLTPEEAEEINKEKTMRDVTEKNSEDSEIVDELKDIKKSLEEEIENESGIQIEDYKKEEPEKKPAKESKKKEKKQEKEPTKKVDVVDEKPKKQEKELFQSMDQEEEREIIENCEDKYIDLLTRASKFKEDLDKETLDYFVNLSKSGDYKERTEIEYKYDLELVEKIEKEFNDNE